jgi:two-component system response regulator FlrC
VTDNANDTANSTPQQSPSALADVASPVTDLSSATRMNEHQVIMATLATTPSKTEAAKRLGISPRTLRYKLAQLRELGLGMASAY